MVCRIQQGDPRLTEATGIQFQTMVSFIICVALGGIWRFRDWLVVVCWPGMNSQLSPPDNHVTATWWIPQDPPWLALLFRSGSLNQALVALLVLCKKNLSAFQVKQQHRRHSSPGNWIEMSPHWAFCLRSLITDWCLVRRWSDQSTDVTSATYDHICIIWRWGVCVWWHNFTHVFLALCFSALLG